MNDLITAADDEHLQFSDEFADPLLSHRRVVSKRRESAYRPGPTPDWLKTKTAA